ncbi:MAG: cadherin domain-containing protein [Planctomycetaceae bacterium]|nr:cadherin domain-containing protein [Planctomycetaceae bacterium]
MLHDWLRRLRSNHHPRARRPRLSGQTVAARIQPLEARALLSASPIVSEFPINTFTTGIQQLPAVVADAEGNFVVAWMSDGQDGSGTGIYAQRYDAVGAKVGGEFRVNTYTTGDQASAAVAMDDDGDFVVTWSSENQDGSGYGVYAQRYNNLGVAVGGEFLVNSLTTGHQGNSSVAMDASGNYVVAWQDEAIDWFLDGFDGDGVGIFAQRFDNTGAMLGGQFRVNTITAGDQYTPDVAMNEAGQFVIAWSSGALPRAQVYDANGAAVGTEIDVSSTPQSLELTYPAVAIDNDGDFAVAWHSGTMIGAELRSSIYMRRFNAAGTGQGNDVLVNTFGGIGQSFADIAMDATGNSVVVWQDFSQDGYAKDSIYGQCFDAGGNMVGTEFKVNDFPAERQLYAAIAMQASGEFVVTWGGQGRDDGSGINGILFGEALDPPLQTLIIGENRPNGQVIGTVEIANPNPVTFAITAGNTSSAFAINASTGVITVNNSAAINFEVNPEFELTVTATEVGNPGNVETITVAILLVDNNEAPTISNQTFGVLDTANVGDGFGRVVVTDPDANPAHMFSIIGGNTGNAFGIVAETGHLYVANDVLNADTMPQFQLIVQLVDGFYTRTATVTVNVIDGGNNQPPVFQPPTTFTISENRPVGHVVGDVNATDPDVDDITYSIVGGDPNAQFAINSTTGVITVAKATINFEATQQFQLQVRATDNGTPSLFATQTVTVNIADLNEAPTFLAPTTFTISENRPVGYVVGDVNTSDPEGNTVTFSIVGGDPNAQFAINASTGVITVAKATINFEATPQFLLQVKAQDNGAPPNSRTQTITVNVANLNEAPNFLPPTTFSVPENSVNGTLVGTVQTADPEGQTVSYAITGGNTNGAFSINAASGQIRVANRNALDFETTPQFLLSVRATDNGSPANSRTQTITVNLTNVADSTAARSVSAEDIAPVDGEFRVHAATTGNQRATPQAVGMDADGDFVVMWSSNGQSGSYDIYGQRYNAAGVAQGGEFLVNTYTTYSQEQAAVAMDADGDFVVTWTSPDGHDGGVFARRYNSAGVAQGSQFRVNTYTTRDQSNSSIAMNSAGDFVVTWTSVSGSADVYAQRYNAGGVAQGGEFLVNTHTTQAQWDSSVAMDADGDFVIAWRSYTQDGDSGGIYAQRYNAAGTALGGEFRVNTYTTFDQLEASVAMDADGDFVITYSSRNSIWAQRYDTAGAAQGGEFLVDSGNTRRQGHSAVAMDADGNFVVTWTSDGQDLGGSGVYAREFDATAVPQGNEFLVNTYTSFNQFNSSVAMDTDGDFVITWMSSFHLPNSADTFDVFAQRYQANDPPVVDDQSFSIAENRPVGTVVGTVVATDANGGPLTFAITAGNTGNVFAINAATGEITVATAMLDSDAMPVFNLTVVVTDNGVPTASDTAAVTINVLDATNHPPEFQPPTTFTISENRPVGYVVGEVNATDPNGDTLTYSIVGGNTDAQFAINSTTGVITVAKGTVNFETTPQYVLQVQALDNGSPAESATQNITINVANLNEPPVFVAPTTFTISENRPVGYVVGDVNAVDPEGNPVTYAIVGGDAKQQFQIDPFTGVITVKKATIDFETTRKYLLQIQASDNAVPNSSRTGTVTVNVANLNEQPVFVGTPSFNHAENQPVGSAVGDVNAVDPDGNALTYSLVGGNPNDQFAIDVTTGLITLAKGSINFEATTQFMVQVKVQDNGNPSQSRTQTYTINITDVNEPPIFVPPTTFSVTENRSVGTVVGEVNAVDPENRPLTYSLVGGNPNGQFGINASTGVITVAKPTIDFETTPQFVLQVKAQDNGSPVMSATQNVTVNVTNLNEAPTFLAPTAFAVAENTPVGVVVGTLQTADPEGNAVTYTIVGGNTNNAFTINPTAGEIIVNNPSALDFETTPQFLLQVKAQDNGSPANSRTQTITVNLINGTGRVALSAVAGSDSAPVDGEFRVNTTVHGSQRTFPQSPQAVAMDDDGNFVVTWTSFYQDGNGPGVYAQRYNATGVAQGGEFLVNSNTIGDQKNATVAMDADGDFVITWTLGYGDVYARRFNAAGVAQGCEFLVNTYTSGSQRFSTVAMDADGDFVITWTSYGQDGVDPNPYTRFNYGIYAQRYDAAGVAQGGEFLVNTYTTDRQQNSTVAMDADGDFVITWASYALDGSGFGIFAQRYDAAGVAQGGEFLINSYTTNGQSSPTVAMDADGDFVVTWSSSTQDGSLSGVFGQRFNAAGVAQGTEFQINTHTNNHQFYSAVAMDDDGDFVVTWTDAVQEGNPFGQGGNNRGIYARQYDAAGIAQGGEFHVNTFTANAQQYSSVAMDADGDFVVVWESDLQDGTQYGVYAQRFGQNLPPAINPLSPTTFGENRPVGYPVATATASDPNPGQTLTYAITAGNTGNVFAINPTTGKITVASPTINFEALDQYVLTIQVTDDGTPALSDSTTFTINIADINEAPTFAAPTTFTISENRPVGHVVGDVNTFDPEGNAVTYSLVGGDPNAQFAINGASGVITVAKATINFEATPQFILQVKAQDNGTPANSRTQNITVNVADLNEPPVFAAPASFAISENRPVGYVVGTVNTVDPEGNAVTYSITAGDANGQFAINANTGQITVAKPTIDFENTPQINLVVKAQDNGNPSNSRTGNIVVNIINLNEAPTFLAPTTFTIPENRPNGTVVGTVSTADPEGQAVTYAITDGNTNNAFSINANTGQITVNNSAALNFETTPQFLLSVKATDNGNPSNNRTQTITVNLTNVIGARVAQQSTALPQSNLGSASGATGQQIAAKPTPAAAPGPSDDLGFALSDDDYDLWLTDALERSAKD